MNDNDAAVQQARAGLRMLNEPDDAAQPAFSLAVLAVAWKIRAEKSEAKVKELERELDPHRGDPIP